MMGWYGGGWDGGWMVVMMLAWVALLGFGVWAVVALTRARQAPTALTGGRESAVDLLDRRLASGEITADEYLELRSVLDVHAAMAGGAA